MCGVSENQARTLAIFHDLKSNPLFQIIHSSILSPISKIFMKLKLVKLTTGINYFYSRNNMPRKTRLIYQVFQVCLSFSTLGQDTSYEILHQQFVIRPCSTRKKATCNNNFSLNLVCYVSMPFSFPANSTLQNQFFNFAKSVLRKKTVEKNGRVKSWGRESTQPAWHEGEGKGKDARMKRENRLESTRKEGLPSKPKTLPFHGRTIFWYEISNLINHIQQNSLS